MSSLHVCIAKFLDGQPHLQDVIRHHCTATLGRIELADFAFAMLDLAHVGILALSNGWFMLRARLTPSDIEMLTALGVNEHDEDDEDAE